MVGDTKSPTLSFQFPPQPPVENIPVDDEETPTVFGRDSVNIPPATRIAQPQSSTQPPPTQVFGAVNQSQNISSNQPPKSQVWAPASTARPW